MKQRNAGPAVGCINRCSLLYPSKATMMEKDAQRSVRIDGNGTFGADTRESLFTRNPPRNPNHMPQNVNSDFVACRLWLAYWGNGNPYRNPS